MGNVHVQIFKFKKRKFIRKNIQIEIIDIFLFIVLLFICYTQ